MQTKLEEILQAVGSQDRPILEGFVLMAEKPKTQSGIRYDCGGAQGLIDYIPEKDQFLAAIDMFRLGLFDTALDAAYAVLEDRKAKNVSNI